MVLYCRDRDYRDYWDEEDELDLLNAGGVDYTFSEPAHREWFDHPETGELWTEDTDDETK